MMYGAPITRSVNLVDDTSFSVTEGCSVRPRVGAIAVVGSGLSKVCAIALSVDIEVVVIVMFVFVYVHRAGGCELCR